MQARPTIALFLLALTAVADAQIISLNPVADALVSAANPTLNYGAGGGLAVAAAGLPKGGFDSLLRFDLSGAKSSFDALYGAGLWSIQSIALTLTATSPNNPLFNGNAAGPGGTNVNAAGLFTLEWWQNDTWVEGTGNPVAPSATGVNFNSLPALGSGADEAVGTFSFNGATSGSTPYALALTPAFVADVSAGNLVSFHAEAADAGVAMLVNARSVGTVAFRPTLTVVAVPEPGSAALALAGLLLLGGARRRI